MACGVSPTESDWVIDQVVKIGREFSVVASISTNAIDWRCEGEGVSLPFAFAEFAFLFGLPFGLPFRVAFPFSFPLAFAELFGSSSFASFLFAFSFGKSSSKRVTQP